MTEETPGQRFRRLRTAARKTQEAVATEIGRTDVTIANWENDRNRMPRSVSALVARALGVSLAELNGVEA
jgi:transcriptional regulator with XRE-family HTH domain